MLVLRRKPGESICIADSVVVTVLGVERGKVRLGIEAPTPIRILRRELQECHSVRVAASGRNASQP
jgi:carbon storage regulator